MMKIYALEGNRQRLDGGAMFGNCPRAVWQSWCPPDEAHRIDLASRAMLICEDDGRNVLLETGIGAFFPPKLKQRYGVIEERHVLLESLATLGLTPDAIDIIVLSHLHFDHAGGILQAHQDESPLSLAFPNATVLVGEAHYQRARTPHPRDRASFIPELPDLLEATGKLEVVPSAAQHSETLGPNYQFTLSNGHTPGLMLTSVQTPAGQITFMGDLIPGTPWVHLPITMGYDRFPECLIDEKQAMLDKLIERNGWLFYTHDPKVVASRLAFDGKRYSATHLVEIGKPGATQLLLDASV